MKENSIEEDMKIIEYNMKCIRNVMNNFEDELCENMQTKTDEVSKIIDNSLSDYKRVLKENELLRQQNISYKNNIHELKYKYNKALSDVIAGVDLYNTYISKQKVKDKIEELRKQDKEWTEELSEPDSNFKIIDRNLKRIKNQIEILQELLEGRK